MLMPGKIKFAIRGLPGLRKLREFLPGLSGVSGEKRRLAGDLRAIYRRLVLTVFLGTGEKLSPALTEDVSEDIASRLQRAWPQWTRIEDRFLRLDLILEIYLFLLVCLYYHIDDLQQQSNSGGESGSLNCGDLLATIERRGPEIMTESFLTVATSQGGEAGSALDMQSQLEEFGQRMNEIIGRLRSRLSPGGERISSGRREELAAEVFAAVVSSDPEETEGAEMLRMRSVLEDYRRELSNLLGDYPRPEGDVSGEISAGSHPEILRSFVLEVMKLKFSRARSLYGDIDGDFLAGSEKRKSHLTGPLVTRLEAVLNPALDHALLSEPGREKREITADIAAHCLKPVSFNTG